MKKIFLLSIIIIFPCATIALAENSDTQYDNKYLAQLSKTDFDRMADFEISENIKSLKILTLKFYKNNPKELRKTTSDTPERMVSWLFHNPYNWEFKEINNAQDTKAINQAFDINFQGDRVLSLITGLYTMMIKAHNGKKDFNMLDSLDPQRIYNTARNIEVVVWKISTKKNKQGKLFFVTNEINDTTHNLSFEREFGKIIARTDYFAAVLSEKKERFITRVLQGASVRLFLPFL